MRKVTLLIILGVLGCGIGASIFFLRSSRESGGSQSAISQFIQDTERAILPTPAPTPFLFEEMTIPYLRRRTYTSSLGERRQISDNGTFISYLTNYDSDGLSINGLLNIPKGEKPAGGYPAIVFIHGYIPPTLYRTQEKYVDYVNYLSRNGFAVFKIDLRGHGSSEGEPGGAYYSSDYVIDALNARAALGSHADIDPERVGLWGHSMAGNVVLRSIAVQPEIKAAVIWAGAGFSYEDLRKYGIDDNSYRPPTNDTQRQQKRRLLMDTYGEFNPASEFWTQVAATNYLTDIKGAIALHHAVDDAVVSVEYSRDLNQRLDQTQIPHESFEYASGGHNLSGTAFSLAMRRTVEFYKKYL